MHRARWLGGASAVALLIAIVAVGRGHAQDFSGRNLQRGRQVAQTKCASCHGANGNSTSPLFPKLAGQDPDYLEQQLQAFRTGARRSDVMAPIAASLSDADLAAAASFYAQQAVRPDRVVNEKLAGVGEDIFYNGANGGGVPACAMCHSPGRRGGAPAMGRMPMGGMMGMGMMGRGMTGPVPSLNGQHAAYIIAQLNRFASGERSGTAMGRIAASLSEADEKAVAAYLSGLP